VSERTGVSASRYLPLVILVTGLVVVVPALAVWVLRDQGVLSSWLVCVLIAVALSLLIALVGSTLWQHGRRSGDLMFSELLLWGWLRRVRADRRLADSGELLESMRAGTPGAGPAEEERNAERLRQVTDALETQDRYTIGHSRRVARNAALVASGMGLSDHEVATVRAAATVHDIGKLDVPREILNKPGKLTAEEFEVVKHHAADGAELVACLGDPELTTIVRHHHERVDGTGYPDGLAGDEIPIGARILAVADTFDAIVSPRPYRRAATHKRAIDVLHEESGTHFDPDVVKAFLNRYAGRRALAIWAALAALAARALGGQQAGRASTAGQTAATAATFAALVTAALAAPIGHHVAVNETVARQAAAPVVSVRRTVKRTVRHGAGAQAASVSPSSTCQAYNPQLCSVLAVGANGSAGGAGGSGAGGGLPFTGLDLALLAFIGGSLVTVGVVMRRLARHRTP
jgi:HD-GYP domain-containing protein (c-di-GMP phosphodiesterase class II)